MQLVQKLPRWRRLAIDAEKIRRLRSNDGNRNACRETAGDRPGNEFDQSPHAGKTHDHENPSCHQGRQNKAGVSVLLDDQQNNRNERRGGTANLNATSPEGGNR